jgi:hypothetical protein
MEHAAQSIAAVLMSAINRAFEDWRRMHLQGDNRAYMFREATFSVKSSELIEAILVKPTWGFPQRTT